MHHWEYLSEVNPICSSATNPQPDRQKLKYWKQDWMMNAWLKPLIKPWRCWLGLQVVQSLITHWGWRLLRGAARRASDGNVPSDKTSRTQQLCYLIKLLMTGQFFTNHTTHQQPDNIYEFSSTQTGQMEQQARPNTNNNHKQIIAPIQGVFHIWICDSPLEDSQKAMFLILTILSISSNSITCNRFKRYVILQ